MRSVRRWFLQSRPRTKTQIDYDEMKLDAVLSHIRIVANDLVNSLAKLDEILKGELSDND